ncbi:MAG: sodium:calcium antiporter [Alphaproteobacteria bacterium]|nr:sodium:calcium antiporter [Alphaproteobacteria bacterium]
MALLSTLSLSANLALFTVLAAVVWFTGTRLSYLADAIAKQTGVSRAIMGLIFLAAITSLPELVTTSAAAIKGDAALALNNILGGITMQTAILAVADAIAIRVTLSSFPRKPTPILEGAILILLLTTTLVIISIGETPLFFNVGLGATLLASIYFISIRVLNRYDKDHPWQPVNLPEPEDVPQILPLHALHDLPLRTLIMQSCGVAVVILVCGILLVETSAAIADQSGLGSSFIGVTLLAATTSLPELSTTIAAVRMGAYTMAVSNIFGSNLIMVFVLFPADFFYREGVILNEAGETAQLALLSGIVVTTIYIIGLLIKKKPRIAGMGLDSILVLGVYLVSVYAFYTVR